MKKTKHGTTNYKELKPFIDTADKNDGYAKFTAEGFMDLTLEKLYYTDYEGNPVYSLAHYGIQNGDLMADPEVTFSINHETGNLMPLSYQNDYMAIYQQIFKQKDNKTLYNPRWLIDVDEFLYLWRKNIIAQGFAPDKMAS